MFGTINYKGFVVLLDPVIYIFHLYVNFAKYTMSVYFLRIAQKYLDLLWMPFERNVTGYAHESFSTVINSAIDFILSFLLFYCFVSPRLDQGHI